MVLLLKRELSKRIVKLRSGREKLKGKQRETWGLVEKNNGNCGKTQQELINELRDLDKSDKQPE
jgi:predicted secreted Zn-dependent protease